MMLPNTSLRVAALTVKGPEMTPHSPLVLFAPTK